MYSFVPALRNPRNVDIHKTRYRTSAAEIAHNGDEIAHHRWLLGPTEGVDETRAVLSEKNAISQCVRSAFLSDRSDFSRAIASIVHIDYEP